MKKRLVEKEKQIWYSVEDKPILKKGDVLFLFDTLESAYNYEVDTEVQGRKYAYKIELLGEVENKITIK